MARSLRGSAWPRTKLVVLLVKECLERGQLTRVGTAANQGANDERDPIGEGRAPFLHGPLGECSARPRHTGDRSRARVPAAESRSSGA